MISSTVSTKSTHDTIATTQLHEPDSSTAFKCAQASLRDTYAAVYQHAQNCAHTTLVLMLTLLLQHQHCSKATTSS
jgi:hypothetical protein